METRTYKVYDFDELNNEQKEKAVNNLRDINVDHDWWTMDDAYIDMLAAHGLKVNMMRGCYFDLDRADYIYCDVKGDGLMIDDLKKFLKTSPKPRLARYADKIYLSIGVSYYGGGSGRNYITAEDQENNTELCEKIAKRYGIDNLDDYLTDYLSDILSDLKSALRRDYEYLTSDEAIIDTIKANEYKFTADGVID